MTRTDDDSVKAITLHWRNFVFVVVFIFLVGIIIGIIITPQPGYRSGPGAETPGTQAQDREPDRTQTKTYPGAIAEAEPEESLPPVRLEEKEPPPRLICRVDPEFPDTPQAAGLTGELALEITTDCTGRVAEVKILYPRSPEIDRAVIEAVRQWVYDPVFFAGRPRGVIFTIRLPLGRN